MMCPLPFILYSLFRKVISERSKPTYIRKGSHWLQYGMTITVPIHGSRVKLLCKRVLDVSISLVIIIILK